MAGPEIAAVMLAGTALQATGAIAQGNAARGAHNYNAEANEQNARVAQEQAAIDAWRVSQRGRQSEGDLRAGIGASGGSIEESIDVLRMSIAHAKLDEETVRYQGLVQATGLRSNAALSRQAGAIAQRTGYLNAASSILTGAGQAGTTYLAGQNNVSLTRTGQQFVRGV